MDNTNKNNILLIEDNKADVRLVKEAFEILNLDINLEIAADGVKALDFLFGNGNYNSAANLDLILLDLNIPRQNGFEVLRRIRKDEKLKTVPVVILTSSRFEDDIYAGYLLKANAVLYKMPDFTEFIAMIQAVYNFWVINKEQPFHFA